MAPRTGVQLMRQARLPRREAPTLVPARPLSGTPDDIVQAMAELLALENPGSTAEALRTLRLAYPDYPLALRLAALAAAMKRAPQEPNGIYIPR